jgi:hypothetical protein
MNETQLEMTRKLIEAMKIAVKASDNAHSALRAAYLEADPLESIVVYELLETHVQITKRIQAASDAIQARAEEKQT